MQVFKWFTKKNFIAETLSMTKSVYEVYTPPFFIVSQPHLY